MNSVFVISDLHLSGTPGREMCSKDGGQRLLAEFVAWLTAEQMGGRNVHLVINGDFVDFLADKFIPFESDPDAARTELRSIISNTKPIWNSLKELVAKGAELTILLGNHDLEMSLPACRELLKEELGRNIRFIYDNEAFVVGPLLIEHGNRFDSWNMVDHDRLRAVRSALSRREEAPGFAPPAGSKLVVDVMNDLKARYSFIDLLKPENEVLLPLLMVLEPAAIKKIQTVLEYQRAAAKNKLSDAFQPLDTRHIAAPGSSGDYFKIGEKLLGIDLSNVSAGDRINDLANLVLNITHETILKGLVQALRLWSADADRRTFDVDAEAREYIGPATQAAQRGFQCVIYGHTHLVKRVPFDGNKVYLNSGTWADLMRLPASVFTGEDSVAALELAGLLQDIKTNTLQRWRHTLASFAQVDFLEDGTLQPDVYWFDGRPHRVENADTQRFFAPPGKAAGIGG